MARAFAILNRNDMTQNMLQVLDLAPNTSQRNFPYHPAEGETGYVNQFVLNVARSVSGVAPGPLTLTADLLGLQAYLLDGISNTTGGGLALTQAQLTTLSGSILTTVQSGLPLTVTVVNTQVQAALGLPPGPLVDGIGLGLSRATLVGLLQVLSGEVYKIPTGSVVAGAAGAYPVPVPPALPNGFFVTPPNAQVTLMTGPGGRKSTSSSFVQGVQPAPHDLSYRGVRAFIETPDLWRSKIMGALKVWTSPTFVFVNGTFTYGPTGSAKTIGGTSIGLNHKAAALVLYSETGDLI